MYGMAAVTVDANSKITDVEIYYKPKTFLRALQSDVDPEAMRKGADIFGKGDPIAAETMASEGSCPLNKREYWC